jgi:hypothetical protein
MYIFESANPFVESLPTYVVVQKEKHEGDCVEVLQNLTIAGDPSYKQSSMMTSLDAVYHFWGDLMPESPI